ncbi:hypothetical protein [Streptomyces sp. CA-179760]|uniref:hypothetical protein n=1 Tax=Streptomyces sp. CA-179760 TaxID=3240054 RepID=UPI003D8E1E3E
MEDRQREALLVECRAKKIEPPRRTRIGCGELELGEHRAPLRQGGALTGPDTALFWSNINPYGTFRLEMDKRLDLAPLLSMPRPRTPADASYQALAEPG